jgi:uncharacterized protein YciI
LVPAGIITEAESLEAARKLIENDVYYAFGVVSVICRRTRYLDFFKFMA